MERQGNKNKPCICLVAKAGPEESALTGTFARLGCRVDLFVSGAQGLEAMRRESYAFLVVVAPVADMHWMTLLRILRSDEQANHQPVLLLLEKGTKLDRREKELLGSYHIDHVMQLPYAEEALKPVVAQLLGQEGEKDKIAQQLSEAKNLYKQGLQRHASRIYREIIKERGESISARTGLIYAVRDQLESYMKQLQYVLEADPENYNYKFELLQFYFSRSEWTKFQVLFDQVLKELHESNEPYWLLQLGEVCLSLNLTSFCNKIATMMMQRPESEDLWKPYLLKARVALAQGDVDVARQWLNKAETSSKQERAEILNMRAIMKRKAGDDSEALALFKRAFGIATDDHRLAFNIALCYRTLHADQEAVQHLQRALQICPTYKRAQDLLRKMT